MVPRLTGVIAQYEAWCGGSTGSFYSDPCARNLYRNHVKTFLNRCGAGMSKGGPALGHSCMQYFQQISYGKGIMIADQTHAI